MSSEHGRRGRGPSMEVQEVRARIMADVRWGKNTIKGIASDHGVSPTTARKVINDAGYRMRLVTEGEFRAVCALRLGKKLKKEGGKP